MEPAKIVGTWPLYIHHLGEHGQDGGLELLAQGEFTVSTNITNSVQTVTTVNFDLAKEVSTLSKPIFLIILTNEEPTGSSTYSNFFKMSAYIGYWGGGNYVASFGYNYTSNINGLNAAKSGSVTNYSGTSEGVFVGSFALTKKSGTANATKGSLRIDYEYKMAGVSAQASDPRGKYSYKVYLLPINLSA